MWALLKGRREKAGKGNEGEEGWEKEKLRGSEEKDDGKRT